jgi:hypothetical protein
MGDSRIGKMDSAKKIGSFMKAFTLDFEEASLNGVFQFGDIYLLLC